MASRRSSRLGSMNSTHPVIDPLTPLLSAGFESQSSGPSLPSSSMSPLAKPRSRKRSVAKRRSLSKKRSTRKARSSSKERDSSTSLDVLQGTQSPTKGRRATVDASTSISPKSIQSFGFGKDQKKELPLPFDVLWLASCTVLAFLYALVAIHPEQTFLKFASNPAINQILQIILPVGGTWQIFARCSALFLIGSIPIRRWTTNHFAETKISSDLIVFSVVGVIKLALIQMFMFKSNEVLYQAAMLHASLGFAVQELAVNIRESPFTRSLQRAIEVIGNSMILFIAEDDVSLKAMAYTLTTLTLAKVLRAFILIASSRDTYRAFRRAVTFGHSALLAFGIPFIANYLMKNAKEMNEDDNPTYAHILAPFICGGVLLSSMVLSHIDYLFD